MKEKNIISYANILESRNKFRKIYSNEEYNPLDAPGTFYFKIMFYFNNPGSVDDGYFTSNLLGLDLTDMTLASSDVSTGIVDKSLVTDNSNMGLQYGSRSAGTSLNSAYNFLVINDELERAEMLKNFIFLLSEISANSPWYFKSIENLDNTSDRAYLKEFKLEERHSITINCLQESEDMRITNLLELYKGACFSHIWRKEIVPANLRKFDMGIYIFQTPIKGESMDNTSKQLGINTNPSSNSVFANSRYIEFHNCEISLDESLKTCYGTPDNEKGFVIDPKIIINYDNCLVSTYNEDLCMVIGDLVQLDMNRDFDAESYINELITARSQSEKNSKLEKLTSQSQVEENNKLKKLITDNTISKGITALKELATKAYLGNVFGMSIRNVVGSVQQITSGDLIGGTSRLLQEGEKTCTSIANGTVISDLIPSLLSKKNENNDLGNVGMRALEGIEPEAAARIRAAQSKKDTIVKQNVFRNK